MGGTWEKNQENRAMRIFKEECSGLVVDIQERLFPVMDKKDQFLKRILVLLEGLKVLKIPLLVTEQYSKGLGSTIEPVKQALETYAAIEKIAFSCLDEPAFSGALGQLGRKKVIICGIEAHVCVLQTVMDLLDGGYSPVVVADCITSRCPEDKTTAIGRMRASGAIITTSESILFELVRVAGTDDFKTISRLVK
jgi:nicotinamidase-related amidase